MAKSKKGIAPTVTSPAKMGEEMAHVQANTDAAPSLKRVKRGGAAGGAEPAYAGNRTGHQERLGAKFAPQMVMSSPNSPESANVGRNVRVLQSAVGNRDFYLRRQYGQNS
jgi:hypothetical protein